MNTSAIEKGLARLGEVLRYHREVEMLLVGGAAGMVTGVLPASRTTIDCDVMVYAPPDAMADVELAAAEVARELLLPPKWLNSDVQLRLDALPVGWMSRRIAVGVFGRLRVWAASRPDLIAMKVLAGRPQDLEDLKAMKVRADDVEFVRVFLDGLAKKGTTAGEIASARELLDALEIHKHE